MPWFGLLGAVIAGLIAHALVFNFVNDDAFISFRYADNLVRHGELVFNPGERVEGYTNFLWTILMAGVIGLGLDPVAWSKGLGIVFSVATLYAVARFSARHEGRASLWDLLGPAMLAGAPAFACWSTGGLETSLFTFTATMGWTGYVLERKTETPRGLPTSGVWFALSAMTRPEGMLLFGLTGLHRLLELVLVERRLRPTKQDWLWGLGFAVVFAPYYAWRWIYYGWPFPNTYYVKTGAKGFWGRGLAYFWSFVAVHHLGALPPLIAIKRGRDRHLLTLCGLIVVGYSVHVIRVGGDFMALHRFLVPLLPILAVLAARGVRGITEALIEAGQARLRLAIGGAIMAALLSVHAARVDREALAVGSENGVDSIGWLAMFAEQCTAIGKWLGENSPEDASLATTAAGIIPFYSRRYTVDVLGLNDEWVAHNVPAHGSRPGHTKSAPLDYILKKQVDYLIYHPTIAKQAPRQSAGEERSWKRRGYVWRSEQIPGLDPPWWGFWQRER